MYKHPVFSCRKPIERILAGCLPIKVIGLRATTSDLYKKQLEVIRNGTGLQGVYLHAHANTAANSIKRKM